MWELRTEFTCAHLMMRRIRGYTVPVDFNLNGAEACDSHMQLRVHVYTSDDA
jgi:hypothetical protein